MKPTPQPYSWKGFSFRTVRQAIRTFRPAFKGERRRVIWAMVLPFIGSLLDLAKPWPMKFVVDELVPSGGGEMRIWGLSGVALAGASAAAFVGITALSGLIAVQSTIASTKVVQRVTVRIRRQVFEHLHRLAFPFHQSSNSGELLERLLGDVDGVRRLIFTSWVSMIERTVLFGGGLVAMAVINVRFALLAVLPLPFYWLILARSSRKLKVVTRAGREGRSQATAIATESLNLIRVVKAYANEQVMVDKFTKESDEGETAGTEAAKISSHLSFYSDLLSGAGVALVLFFGAMQALRGDLTPGFLVVLTSYAGSLFRPLRKMSKEGGYLSSAVVSAERLMEVLEIAPEDSQTGLPAPAFRGEVEFKDVRFTHDGGVEALRGLTFKVPAGSLAVLAGPNGAGKSTAFSILLRLVTCESGEVLIDGQPIDTWQLDGYRRRFSYVPQDIQLFSGKIRENILYGRPDASDDEVERASADSLLDEVVSRLPNGYDEKVGEGGSTLSGGEARRLMLARAALRDASILLFDEPFTGLDKEARATVAGAIRRIAAGRTALVISHGPAEELSPDLVIEIQAGRRKPPAGLEKPGSSDAVRPSGRLPAPSQFGDLARLLDDGSALQLFKESGIELSGVERDFTGVWTDSALVSFRFLPSGDATTGLSGYVRTYRNGSASAVASKWNGRAAGTSLGPGVRLLAGGCSVLFLFPNDDVLEQLGKVSDPGFLQEVLQEHGELRGPWAGCKVTTDYTRYRPERRLVSRIILTGENGCIEGAPRFYVRHLPAASGRRLDRLARSLREEAGFDRIPRAVGTALNGSVFIEEAIEAVPLQDAIAAGQAEPRALAGALRSLHESGVREGEFRTPHGRLAQSLEILEQLGCVEQWLPSCLELADNLAEYLPSWVPNCLLHGDLHPKQVLIGERGAFFVDLEDVAIGDPFDDVGHLVAHLVYFAGWQDKELKARVLDFTSRFALAYGVSGRPYTDLAFYTARAYIQRASSAFRRQRGAWHQRTSRNLDYAVKVLRGTIL